MLRRLLGIERNPEDVVDDPPVRFRFATGTYHAVWENKAQPDGAGAYRYAWESLDLAQFSPIGPGTAVRRQIRETQPGGYWFSSKQVVENGIPTIAGQLLHEPLIDPERGYVPDGLTLGYPDAAGYNIPSERAPMTRYSDPNPYGPRKGT